MQGFLYLTGATAPKEGIDIPKNITFLSIHGGGVVLEPTEQADSVCSLKWEPRRRSWVVYTKNQDCFVNGANPKIRGSALSAGDIINYRVVNLRFESLRAAPLYEGEETDSLDLAKVTKLTLGRLSESAPEGERIDLDSDDFTISKEHVVVEREGEEWFIQDLSKAGAELNGRLFTRELLVFGDRFRISEYIFEFDGVAIKRIDNQDLGRMTSNNLIVTVKDRVSKEPKNILDDVSVSTKPGEFVGILGGSGQGKSTLLDALCGIRPAQKGEVKIGGVKNTELAHTRPGTIGYVPQDDIVHSELTVDQAFYYSAKLRLPLKKAQLSALIDRTIEVLGLSEHRNKGIKFLSGGQRKRVSIGIELLSKPSILFLDEPSSGLDPATEKSLMELLQALSLNNLTVVCTTHVLQNAFLFNKLWYVHGGKLIFEGNAEESREFFLDKQLSLSHSNMSAKAVQSPLEKIYPTVLQGTKTAEEWETRYKESEYYARNASSQEEPSSVNLTKGRRPNAFTKLITLLRRQLSIMNSDWLNIAFLIAQVLVIGLLVSWVAEDMGLRAFLGIIAAMWFGCSNGAQQIVAEIPIFMRERVCGLGLNVYITSKVLFQGAISSAQAILLFAVILFGGNYFHGDEFDSESFQERLIERNFPYVVDESLLNEDVDLDFIPTEEGEAVEEFDDSGLDSALDNEQKKEVSQSEMIEWIAKTFALRENILDSGDRALSFPDGMPVMGNDKVQKVVKGLDIWEVIWTSLGLRLLSYLSAAMVGVSLGLMVSSLVRTPTQAVMWVPLLLIPQILFGGFVISLAEMNKTVRQAAVVFPSYSCQRVSDVSHLYGRSTPYLTNRTKYPIFLTSEGDKETVEWSEGDKDRSQDYDEVSGVNTSWQNLAIRFERISEHKQEYTKSKKSYKKNYRDTVKERRDVKYKKGTPFLHISPAFSALIWLTGWIVFTYTIILISLWRRKV